MEYQFRRVNHQVVASDWKGVFQFSAITWEKAARELEEFWESEKAG